MANKMQKMKTPAPGAEQAEVTAEQLAKALYKQRKDVLNAIGDRPFMGMPMSEQERAAHYRDMANDPQSWAELLASNVRIKDDGRLLVRKGLLVELSKLEKARTEGSL